MKRIVLLCCLIAATSNMSFAQTTANHNTGATKANAAATTVSASETPKISHQTLFGSKINEVDAAITRNNEAWAQGSMTKALFLMEQEMGGVPAANTKNTNVTATTKISKQHQLYNKAKSMSGNWNDMVTNHTAIIAALREFGQLMND
ncbi:MAG: hypothetical protein WCG87_08820 [Bacteroidota bacterium]